nr:helix-turn-helix domain-containing protein [Kibdelosporangium sp. MJ126-NF4]CEL16169.1 High-affnity carbon uptake protein Hat/HatR [Kibdelosporangium sp. MJ126-NF4]CTQ94094.1 High-affnity carbon uptake protein Hat/HatR [Kibdelosporangium sp. MJ126-NF4]
MPRPERPLEFDGTVVPEFAANLRRLREKAGSPPYRELARRAHYSSATLADAAGGRRMPSLDVTLAYVRACGGDAERWKQEWREATAELSAPADQEILENPPYVGLSSYGPDDADRFCGRDRLVEDLLARLAKQHFLAVFGASGSGKSSVLRAGLTPRLVDSPATAVLLFTPGSQPVEECAIHLSRFTGRPASEVYQELVEDPRNLRLIVRQALAGQAPDARIVLIVDQFEELFTQCLDAGQRSLFITALTTAAQARCRVVLGVRADFYSHCSMVAELATAMRDAQVTVGPLTEEELRSAISTPAVRSGCRVESALLAHLVAHANNRAGTLPLLSHALLETWRRRRGSLLTLAGFHAAGGMDGALSQTAENVFTWFSENQQRLVRNLFQRLIALGEGTEDTKRRVRVDELDSDPDMDVVVDRLARARLVVVDQDGIEMSHEALIRSWPRLGEWLAEDRAGLRTHRLLTEATQTWESLDHDPGTLYRGARLSTARDWAAHHGDVLNDRERRFLNASSAAMTRATWTRRALVALVVVLALIATTAAIVAFEQRDEARFHQLVAEADRLRRSDPSLAARLNLVAHGMRSADKDVQTRLLSTEQDALATSLAGHEGSVYWTAFSPDGNTIATAGHDHTVRLWNVSDRPRPFGPPIAAHTGYVTSAVFSPDGRTLVTAGDDHTIRFWNVTDPARPQAVGSPVFSDSGTIYTAVFSPDGRTLATANDNHTAQLWDVTNVTHPVRSGPALTGHADRVRTVVFSGDSRTLATAGNDNTVRLWDVTAPATPVPLGQPLTGHNDIVHSVAFSPDNRTLASTSNDRTVRLWNVADPAHAAPLGVPLTGHTGDIWQVAFSPDGRVLGSAGDNAVRLWNVSDPAKARALGEPLASASGSVFSLAFSPDGHFLAVGGDDGTTRLWSLPATLLLGHGAAVTGAQFNRDGRLLATTSRDGTVRLWDTRDPQRPVPLGPPPSGRPVYVSTVAFSPDGHTLAASGDDFVQLWDVGDPIHPRRLGEPLVLGTRYGSPAVFSPDGRTLVTGDDDQSLRLWDVTGPATPRPLSRIPSGHGTYGNSVVFSPDGRTLATASHSDPDLKLWNVSDPATPRLLGEPVIGHTAPIRSMDFSASGRLLATGADDQTIRLWDVTDPARPHLLGAPLVGHTDGVSSVVFSPDGNTLFSGSPDRTLRLWDVSDPARPKQSGSPITTDTDATTVVTGSSNGVLVTAGGDGTARVWTLDVSHAVQRICADTYHVLDPEQWQRHIPQFSYAPPCPE